MRNGLKPALLFAAALLPIASVAHPKHEHMALGTVRSVAEARLELETADGSPLSVLVTAETVIERAGGAISLEDIHPGERVAVRYVEDEEGRHVAKQVLLGAAPERGSPRGAGAGPGTRPSAR
jgi:hypothetical protein